MINPYICTLCKEQGRSEPAYYRINFLPDTEPVPPLYLCDGCFSLYPPEEYLSIDNLRIELERERGCCG